MHLFKRKEPRVYLVTGRKPISWLDEEFVSYAARMNPLKEIRVPEFKSRRGIAG